MKKIFAILLALLVLIVPCCIGASAAGAINAEEQRILDYLDQYVQLGKTKYHIPDEYIAQAKNSFLTVDINKAQADEIIGYISEGVEILKSDSRPDEEFHLNILPPADKQKILDLGKEACEVIDQTLVYDSVEHHVVITTEDASGAPVSLFDSAPVIKTTGGEVNAIVIASAVLAVVMVAAFVISKKVKLF